MLYCQTYVDERYKLTMYRDGSCGELYDLEEDPDELHNLWDDPDSRELKTELPLEMISAKMGA